MDPRHPELAVSRIKELIEQYDRIEKDMAKANTSAQLGQLEREGGLVVQEICLVAPRIHEAMMQTSRQRRHNLSRGIAFGYTPEEKVGKYTKATIGIEKKPVEGPERYTEMAEVLDHSMTKEQEQVFEEMAKPTKKTTRKKKTTKKLIERARETDSVLSHKLADYLGHAMATIDYHKSLFDKTEKK